MGKDDQIESVSNDPEQIEALIDVIDGTSNSPSHTGKSIVTDVVHKLQLKLSDGRLFEDLLQIKNTISNTDQPCFVVRSSGRIVAQNIAADLATGRAAYEFMDDVDLHPVEGGTWPSVLRGVLGQDVPSKPKFFKAHSVTSEKDFYVVVVPTNLRINHEPHAIILLADTLWSDELKKICQENYGLTASELIVVEEFVNGRSLRDIAQDTARSIATVRKHLYTVFEKFGVSSQTELVREVFSFSNLLAVSKPIAEKHRTPRRAKVNLLRPGGRIVELFISGDRSGTVTLGLSDGSFLCFGPQVEEELYDTHQCFITVVRPGFGETSVEGPGESYEECVAGDIAAVLDQLGLRSAQLFAPHLAFLTALRVAHLLPDRITRIVTINVVPPSFYYQGRRANGSFVRMAQSIIMGNRIVSELSLRMAAEAVSVLGGQKVVRVLFQDKKKLQRFLHPSVLQELDDAIRSVVAQGTKAIAVDYMRVFTDWRDVLESCPVPVLNLLGAVDEFAESESYQRFNADFSHKFKAHTITQEHPPGIDVVRSLRLSLEML